MAKEKPEITHEQAFDVLKKAIKEGTLAETLQARLVVLARECVRPQTTQVLEERPINSPAAAPLIIVRDNAKDKLVQELGLKEGHARAIEAIKKLQACPHSPAGLSYKRVLRVFTPEMLEVAQSFQEPKLVLTAKGYSHRQLEENRLFRRYGSRDGKQPLSWPNLYFDGVMRKHCDIKAEFNGAYIIESPVHPEVQDFDDDSLNISQRLKGFEKYKEVHGVSGMDRWRYIYLTALSLIDGWELDYRWPKDGYMKATILDEDPLMLMKPRQLVSGEYKPRLEESRVCAGPGFRSVLPGFRFRRSVGGLLPDL